MRFKLARSGPWIGVAGLAVMLWITFASLFFAPWWGIGLFLVLWGSAVVLVVKWSRSKPKQCAFVPFGEFVAWLALSVVGGTWWGWGG